jgi:hypothetical protein
LVRYNRALDDERIVCPYVMVLPLDELELLDDELLELLPQSGPNQLPTMI